MKSTNRQFYLKTNPAKNHLKMCLLNCILISIITLTHCLPIPTTLSGAMQKYPKYRDTLLSPEIVPFVNECETNELKPNEKMLCGSYFEMIDKLDHSSLQGLTTVEDFNKAMNVYNPTNIEEFCDKFPGYLPNDPKVYPDSYTLRTRLPDICEGLCSGFDANFAKLVKPICKIYAIGFQLSNAEIQAVQVTNAVTNSTVNLLAEGSLNSGNVRQDTSGSVTLDKGKLSVAVPIVANGTDAAIKPKQVVNLTITKAKDIEVNENIDEKIVDGLGEKTEKDNSSPNSGPALAGISASAGGSASGGGSASAAERLQKINVGESDTNTSPAKSNATETVKQELKTTAKTLNPIENSIPNGETSEKIQTNDEDNAGEDNYTVAIIEKNDIEAGNYNDDDEDDLIEPKPAQLDKSPPQQSNEKLPSDEQLHNEEDPFTDDTDSNFFTYFMFLLLVCVIAYVVYHNKSKMLALMLEGRRSNTGGRGSLSRRKHTAAYRKLDSNLEEAITSSGNGRSTQVIY